MEAGADDYLPKPFSPAELVVRVKRILDRSTAGSVETPALSPILAAGDLIVDRDRHGATLAGRPLELTTLEFRLLATLLQADGRVLNREQLLDAMYGEGEAFVLDRSIDAVIKRLRRKLGDDPDRPRYVATVRGVGYRFVLNDVEGA